VSRPAHEAPPKRGQLYTVAVEGTRIDRAVILSENAWNSYTYDCVLVPFFHDPDARETVVRPRLDANLIADCTAVGSLAQDDLGDYLGDCPDDVLASVAAGVRTYFAIDQALNPPRVRPRVPGRAGWWPRQAEVHLATRIADEGKWVTIVSEDASNAVLNHAAGARLTSVASKRRRERWEVPVRGGYVICNDLHAIPHSGFEQRPRISPPFARLNQSEQRALAERLVETLEL
jgi:mRNA-degrading endonuclease toxin of MazEF toxin-antitoxin module